MVKVHVDISVFTADASLGMVSGSFEVAVVPQVGDIMSFRLAEKIEAYVGERRLPFVGHVRVTNRIIPIPAPDADVLLTLEDITATTPSEAARLLKWFEQDHGLFGDVWDG